MHTNISAKELGEYLGLTARRVHQLCHDGLPFTPNGKQKLFNLKTALPWYISQIRKNKESEGYDAERTRLVKAQADKTELETKIKRGEVLELELVEQGMMAVAAVYSSGRDSISGRLANDLAAESDVAKVQMMLDEEVRRGTNEVTHRLASIAEYREDGDDTESAADEVSVGVG